MFQILAVESPDLKIKQLGWKRFLLNRVIKETMKEKKKRSELTNNEAVLIFTSIIPTASNLFPNIQEFLLLYQEK